MAYRSTSAPVSCVCVARSARAAAASARSARSSSTHLPCDRISGRAWLASWEISAAVSSTSSNTADQRTCASWWAPTTDGSLATVSRRSAGEGLRRDSAGTRTSKPAASACGPVVVISSHASSWLSTTWPRRASPGRFSTGISRSSRASSSARCRFGRLSISATSSGTSCPSRSGPETERNHAWSLSGGSSWTTRRASDGAVTGVDHRSRRLATSVPARAGTSNAEPSSRVSRVSAMVTGSRRVRRRRRQRQPGGGICGDGVDDRPEHRQRERSCLGAFQRGDRARQRRGQLVDLLRAEQRRAPPHRQLHLLVVALPAAAPCAHTRHDRPVRHQSDGQHRHPSRAR